MTNSPFTENRSTAETDQRWKTCSSSSATSLISGYR
jgi:hypothetical protein